MSKWEFFELDQDKSVVPLSIQNLKVVSWLENTLGVAAESKVPNPKFSKYYVNCACFYIIHALKRVVSVYTNREKNQYKKFYKHCYTVLYIFYNFNIE